MKDRKHSAQSNPEDEDTITNVALFPPEQAGADADMGQLDMVIPASNTSFSLGRLEHDLKALHEKWNTVEQEMTRRDRQIANLQQDIDSAQREAGTLRQRKEQLEQDLEERQNTAITSGIRLTEIEAQNVELRVHLQELQDYIDGRKSDWERLNTQLREYEDTIQGINSCLGEHEAIVAAKEQEKATLAAQVMDLERELAELKGKHAERESTNVELQQTMTEQARELGNLNGETIGLRKEIERLQQELEQKDANIQSLQDDLEERSNDGVSVEELVETHASEVAELLEELNAANMRVAELEDNDGKLTDELATLRSQLEDVGVKSAEHEIRAVELQAVLLEAQSDQKNLEAELEAQRELVQVLEAEVSNKQQELETLDRSADRLSAISSEIREIDFQIDDRWCEQPAAMFDDADGIFDPEPDDVMLTPEELFPEPEDLAEHVIVSEDGEGEPIRYPLTGSKMTIGRSHKADIRLNNKYISREHARITVDDAGVLIEDAGSMNGFLVNSEPTTRHRLVHGDRLEIGKSRFQYLDNSMT